MKRNLLIILTVLLCSACGNKVQSEKLHFTQNGFSIAPLEEATKSDTPYQALMMYLPFSDNFAPNVNVQMKPHTGTIEDYIKQNKELLEKGNLKMIKEDRIGDDTYAFEYTGSFRDLSVHLYTRSVLSSGRVYVVTAGAMESQWEKYSGKLKNCVDSFELDKSK